MLPKLFFNEIIYVRFKNLKKYIFMIDKQFQYIHRNSLKKICFQTSAQLCNNKPKENNNF